MSLLESKIGRIIPSLCLSGPKQMALDEFLLEQSITNKGFTAYFRLYKWDGIWLSIGKNQRLIPDKWKQLSEEKLFRIVRRPTGGSAVLHAGGITYSLIFPDDKNPKTLFYLNQCKWLIKAFKEIGISLSFGNQPQNPQSRNCFRSSTKADLIDSDGNKIIGSAQLWRKKHVLQHGEILIHPPIDLWKEIFNIPPPATRNNAFSSIDLYKLFLKAFISSYPDIDWKEKNPSREELDRISINSKRYLIK